MLAWPSTSQITAIFNMASPLRTAPRGREVVRFLIIESFKYPCPKGYHISAEITRRPGCKMPNFLREPLPNKGRMLNLQGKAQNPIDKIGGLGYHRENQSKQAVKRNSNRAPLAQRGRVWCERPLWIRRISPWSSALKTRFGPVGGGGIPPLSGKPIYILYNVCETEGPALPGI